MPANKPTSVHHLWLALLLACTMLVSSGEVLSSVEAQAIGVEQEFKACDSQADERQNDNGFAASRMAAPVCRKYSNAQVVTSTAGLHHAPGDPIRGPPT